MTEHWANSSRDGLMPYEPIFTDDFKNELAWRKKKDRTTYNRIMRSWLRYWIIQK